jgi:alpha-tubulin suppressor-like RCC1 family protein
MKNPGIGFSGEMARSANMTMPDENGKYDLQKLYLKGDKDEGFHVLEEAIKKHFLLPKPVIFANEPHLKRTILAVACGTFHIMVVASDPNDSRGKLYTSGLNKDGQLGLGDSGEGTERHALTLVRLISNIKCSLRYFFSHLSLPFSFLSIYNAKNLG